jgi:hypothetical protein
VKLERPVRVRLRGRVPAPGLLHVHWLRPEPCRWLKALPPFGRFRQAESFRWNRLMLLRGLTGWLPGVRWCG